MSKQPACRAARVAVHPEAFDPCDCFQCRHGASCVATKIRVKAYLEGLVAPGRTPAVTTTRHIIRVPIGLKPYGRPPLITRAFRFVFGFHPAMLKARRSV